ncbi:hypothetical protein BN12_380009 [Nostocoides japonicum T1-X7]|uniref:Uncharacterized protein n=1 Tax=Nostocoides japonicum T1-X7 TaxID=1194083 RepID=A0A077M1G6_9MICO|nr:hypothetical protein BN12_380009 [Tetrasphaera japonica T1-X7]
MLKDSTDFSRDRTAELSLVLDLQPSLGTPQSVENTTSGSGIMLRRNDSVGGLHEGSHGGTPTYRESALAPSICNCRLEHL